MGVWAVIAGLVEFSAAFRSGEPAGTRAILILGGLVTIAFGVVLCARPGIGAITLALLFGLFNLIAGIWMLGQGIELRRTGKALDSAMREKNARPSPIASLVHSQRARRMEGSVLMGKAGGGC